jgi:hypothetical protein
MSYEEYRLRQENAALRNRLNDKPLSLEERLRQFAEDLKKGRVKIRPTKKAPPARD